MSYLCKLPHKNRFRDPAKRLIWWMSPDEALAQPMRLLAQIMNIGTLDDLRLLQEEFSDKELEDILRHAPPGILSAQAVRFWQVVLHTEAAPAPRFTDSDPTGLQWSRS